MNTPLGEVELKVLSDGTVMVRSLGVRIIIDAGQAKEFGEQLFMAGCSAQELLDSRPELGTQQ